MAKDFFKQFIDDLGDPDTSVAIEGKSSAEFAGFIDTGSYILNAAFSGDMFGGFPNNKAIILAGDPAVGKTFFALSLMKRFLDANPKGRIFYYDTEGAVTNAMLTSWDIDLSRISKSEPVSLEDFRNKTVMLLDKYAALSAKDRFPALLVLDSLSQLPSQKEVEDARAANNVRDMTKASIIKGIFRVIRLKLASLQIPLIVTNHVYAVIGGYGNQKEVGGGQGAKYASDFICMLSKAQDKDGTKVVGNIITATMTKSRMTKEKTKVHTRILFDGGLDRYYGLLEYAILFGLVVKVGNKVKFPDGAAAFESQVYKNPAKFWSQDLLNTLNAKLGAEFKYSAAPAADVAEEEDTPDDAE